MTERETSLLPDELSQGLRRLDWRVRGFAVLRGIGLLCVVMCAGVGIGMLVDWLWGVGVTTRTAMLIGMIGATVVTLVWAVIRPMFGRITAAELAAIVDTAYPELGECVEAAVELSNPDMQEAHRGSAVMRAKVIDETIRRTDDIDFADAAEPNSAMRWLGIAGLTLLLLLVPFGLSREGYGLLLTRFFHPWKNVERATNLVLVVENGDRTVAVGADVTIVAEPQWRIAPGTRPEYAWLRWQSTDDKTDERRMDFDEESSAYRATLPQVLTSFDYDVSAGSAQTRTFHIDVIEAPEIERLIVELEPPAYLGRPARTIDGPLGRIEVFEQSRLTIRAELSKPIAQAELLWLMSETGQADDASEESVPLPCTLSEDGLSATHTMIAEQSGEFSLRLRDEHGVTNLPGEPWELRVTADQPPVIGWGEANRELRVPGATLEFQPDEQVPVSVIAADDVSVAELELYAEVVQRSEPLEPVIADTALLGPSEIGYTFTLDLSQHTLQEGDLLSLRARVVDNRPQPGPQEAWTELKLVRISQEAESVEESQLVQKRQQLREILEGIRKNVQQDRETTDTMRDAARQAAAQDKPVEQQEPIAELSRRTEDLSQKLDQLATVFSGHQLQRNLAEATRSIGTETLGQARQQFTQAEASPPQEQLEQLTKAADELARADDQLGELLKRFDELAALEQDLMRLQQLAEDAEELSQEVAEFEQQSDELAANQDLSEEQRQNRESELAEQQDKLRTDQESLAGGLDRLLEERPEVLDAARQQQTARLQQLGQLASRLAEQEARLVEVLTAEVGQSSDGEPSDEPATNAEQTGEESSGNEPSGDEPTNSESSEGSPNDGAPSRTQPSDYEHSDNERFAETARQLRELNERLQQMAEEAARLAINTARTKGVESPASQRAREFAEQALEAADDANAGLLPDAAESTQSGSEAAQQTSDELHDPTDPSPEQLAQQAEDLAARQQALAEELQQLAESPEARQQAQAEGQQRMSQETSRLSEQLDEIAQRLQDEPLSETEQAEQAESASESSQQASESIMQAEQDLRERTPEPAAESAQQAQEALQQAAEVLGQMPSPEEPSPVPGEVGEQVAEARRQLAQAGQQLGPQTGKPSEPMPTEESPAEQPPTETPPEPTDEPPPTEEPPPPGEQSTEDQPPGGDQPNGEQTPGDGGEQGDKPSDQGDPGDQGEPSESSMDGDQQSASQAMQHVAESLKQAAQQLGMSGAPSGEKGKPGDQPSEASEGEPGDESGTAGRSPISLAELEAELSKMATRDWGQLPGEIESELFQSTQKKPDSDYARLIRQYFEEVSRRRTAREDLDNE